MFTPNRGYPLLGGQSIDDIGDDLNSINQALTMIDADLGFGLGGFGGLTLLNQMSYAGPAPIARIGWDFVALGADVSPGSTFLATWDKVVSNSGLNTHTTDRFSLEPGDGSANNCHFATLMIGVGSRSFEADTVSKRWPLGATDTTQAMYIRKVSALMRLSENGADVQYCSSYSPASSQFIQNSESFGRGKVGFGTGTLANSAVKPTKLFLYGASSEVFPNLVSCASARLYRLDDNFARQLF